MATFDIRNIETIHKIKFNDSQYIYVSGDNVMVEGHCVTSKIPKQAVQHLIRALQKAIELGWTE